jgi:flagellar hook-associated protein 1 FlgK
MSSLNAILNTASNAVTAYQSAISVTGQNIANADNDDYSIQSAELATTSTVTSRGNIYGTGVTVASVARSVNQIIENALNSELSSQAALEEAQVYMSSIEDLFSEDSVDSVNTLLDAYWSAWEDLSNNPSGQTEQNAVYDAGLALTDRINAIEAALSDLTEDLDSEISSAVTEVNSLSQQIAGLNLGIINAESTGGNANDLADERNALVSDLGERLDIDLIVKEDGAYLINTCGLPLVEDGISYDLNLDQGSVYWTGKSGNTYDITDDIPGGAIAGWLEVRDVVIPETQAEFDELATNLIWTLNYQHSQGAGQTYFSGALAGTYKAGDSRTFDSLYYGDEIDYTKDFSMVIQDATDTTSEYQTVTMDMGISTSDISNITGPGETDSIYELTVIDEGTLGDKTVVQSSGSLLGGVSYRPTGISDAMDAALAEQQTLTITNGSDTQTLEISDSGPGAIRSAADIAKELSGIDGIDAYASTTSAYFDTSDILANDGDVVEFTLSVDGEEETVSFFRDVFEDIDEQFEDALKAAAESINETNQNTDLAVDGTSTGASIESASGATIGIYDFNVADPFTNTGGKLSVSLDSSGSEIESLSDNPATDDAVAIVGSVSIFMDPGMQISSDENSAAGLFGAGGTPVTGTSMITLGGPGGYEGFDNGDTISFNIDESHSVTYTVGVDLTDIKQAELLETNITLPPAYQVIRNGAYVTILKTADEADDAITITDFTDATNDNAELSVSTGTGEGSDDPENDTLVSSSTTKDSTKAATFGDPATIYWEIFDNDGNASGKSGYVEIDESGAVEIDSTGTPVSFDISQGSLVAGNTLRINTDNSGEADILQGSVTGNAASVDDMYAFTVTSGGTLPDDKDDIVIQWTSETGSGTIKLKDDKDEERRITADVDGMTIAFDSGTLVNGDVFYVTTDENGKAVGDTIQTLSEWHWTLDSFADEFNRSAGGVNASVTQDNSIVFDTHDDYCAIENVICSGSHNIDEENFEIKVLNYSALEFEAEGLEFERKSDGTWGVNNPTGGTIDIIPKDGDDNGFQIDLTSNGIGDIEITFDQPVSGDGSIRMDLKSRDADDLSYAFAGNEDGDSGVAAALGVNTFFTGTKASDISVNDVLSDTDLLASGLLDTQTGALAAGDNTNALAMADTRYDSVDMKAYTYTRGEGVTVSVTTTSLDDYQASMVSTIGSTAAGINSALEYSETLVYQLTAQRDSISAVSLDEEMINLTAQQQAYLAAAKLLTTVQEMFDALLATR